MGWRIVIHTLDVDQGDCSILCLIQTDLHGNEQLRRQILIDGGRLRHIDSIYEFIEKNDIEPHFDCIVVTHFDDDHVGGIERILEDGNIASFCIRTAEFVTTALRIYAEERYLEMADMDHANRIFRSVELVLAAPLFTLAYFKGMEEQETAILLHRETMNTEEDSLLWGMTMDERWEWDEVYQACEVFDGIFAKQRCHGPVLETIDLGLIELVLELTEGLVGQYCEEIGLDMYEPIGQNEIYELLHTALLNEIENLCENKLSKRYTSSRIWRMRDLSRGSIIITPSTAFSYDINHFERLVNGMITWGDFRTRSENRVILNRTWYRDGGTGFCEDVLAFLGNDLLPLIMPEELLAHPFYDPHLHLLCVGGHTIAGGFPANNNNVCSVGLLLKLGDFAYYTAGDLPSELEDEIINVVMNTEIDGTRLSSIPLFKASHHGSRGSTSQFFLDCAKPQCALISCGSSAEFDHPNEELLQRMQYHCGTLARVFLTGCVDARKYTVDSSGRQGFGPIKAFIAGTYDEHSGTIISKYDMASPGSFSVRCINKDGRGIDVPGLYTFHKVIS